jgi:hypothetical protein
MKKTFLMILLVLGLIMVFSIGCNNDGHKGNGSSSGGGHSKLDICQVCDYNSDCQSNRCVEFDSGYKRCIPSMYSGSSYYCQGGYYGLTNKPFGTNDFDTAVCK